MTDDAAIRQLLDRRNRAIHDKDADAMLPLYATGALMFELAPPLAYTIDPKRSREGFIGWFGTWKGPIGYDSSDITIEAHGDLALVTGFLHIHGLKTDGARPDGWYRQTVALKKSGGAWRIVHQHTSVPYYMDGSDRAALDLKP